MSKGLCSYAFDTLYSKLNSTSPAPLAKHLATLGEASSNFPPSAPLFITWNQNGSLRGCIGTFAAQPLEKGVFRFALVSALEDTRFSPISISELNSTLSVSVTLLDNFTEIHAWDDWTVGLNGLKVSIRFNGSYHSGTFLPSVAEDEGWSKEVTLYYLLRKADLFGVQRSGVIDFYKKGLKEGWIELTRYDGLKSGLDYDEFVKIRHDL